MPQPNDRAILAAGRLRDRVIPILQQHDYQPPAELTRALDTFTALNTTEAPAEDPVQHARDLTAESNMVTAIHRFALERTAAAEWTLAKNLMAGVVAAQALNSFSAPDALAALRQPYETATKQLTKYLSDIPTPHRRDEAALGRSTGKPGQSYRRALETMGQLDQLAAAVKEVDQLSGAAATGGRFAPAARWTRFANYAGWQTYSGRTSTSTVHASPDPDWCKRWAPVVECGTPWLPTTQQHRAHVAELEQWAKDNEPRPFAA